MSRIILYNYFRSSAAYRVRIALNLKGLAYQPRGIDLVAAAGEHRQSAYRSINPQGLAPTLVDYLKDAQGTEKDACLIWYCHWIDEGFSAIEQWLSSKPSSHGFCHGDSATLADVCLIPQVYNAIRYQCDLSGYPIIKSIYDHCLTIEAFERAAPENQPDARQSPAADAKPGTQP